MRTRMGRIYGWLISQASQSVNPAACPEPVEGICCSSVDILGKKGMIIGRGGDHCLESLKLL